MTATAPAGNALQPRLPGAERTRRHRERARMQMRSIRLDIRENEVKLLVSRGLLAPDGRDDPDQIAAALGLFLDQALR